MLQSVINGLNQIRTINECSLYSKSSDETFSNYMDGHEYKVRRKVINIVATKLVLLRPQRILVLLYSQNIVDYIDEVQMTANWLDGNVRHASDPSLFNKDKNEYILAQEFTDLATAVLENLKHGWQDDMRSVAEDMQNRFVPLELCTTQLIHGQWWPECSCLIT